MALGFMLWEYMFLMALLLTGSLKAQAGMACALNVQDRVVLVVALQILACPAPLQLSSAQLSMCTSCHSPLLSHACMSQLCSQQEEEAYIKLAQRLRS